jgi:hypothetical protein
MSFIYLVNPIGTELRPIDKDKRFEIGKRPKPPKVNNLNVKIGKWESDIKSLIKRYEYRVGNVNVKIVLEVDKNKIKGFEKHLKNNCFKEFIKNYQELTGRVTKEWMYSINIYQAEQIIIKEAKKFKL